jgi:hypothetical protein
MVRRSRERNSSAVPEREASAWLAQTGIKPKEIAARLEGENISPKTVTRFFRGERTDVKTHEAIARKLEGLLRAKASITLDDKGRPVRPPLLPFPKFLADVLERLKQEAGEQRQAIQRLPEMTIEDANEMLKQEIQESQERHIMYISAFDLSCAEQLLSSFYNAEPPIERIIVRRMSEETRRRLRSFLPDHLELTYRKNKVRISRLKFAGNRFINDDHCWPLLPPFHGVLYGEILSWGRWEVDDDGLLTLQRARMHVIKKTDNESLFSRCWKLMTEWGRLDTAE